MIFVVITVIIKTFQFLVDEVIPFVQSLIFDSSAFFYSSTIKRLSRDFYHRRAFLNNFSNIQREDVVTHSPLPEFYIFRLPILLIRK